MVFIDGVKYACERCIRGHRVTACQHIDQPLTMIKRKGRPSTQCQHCREHRKLKNLHTKCKCGIRSGPHSRGCPCHFNPELCTCSNKKKTVGSPTKTARASPVKGSSARRTASNPPSATPSRIHTPGLSPMADVGLMTRSASTNNLMQFADFDAPSSNSTSPIPQLPQGEPATQVQDLQDPWRFPYRPTTTTSGYTVPLQPPSMVFADVAYEQPADDAGQVLSSQPPLHRSDDSISSISTVHTLPNSAVYPVAYDHTKPFAYFDEMTAVDPLHNMNGAAVPVMTTTDFVDLLEGDSNNNNSFNTCAQAKLNDDLWYSSLLQGSQYV
ncbi:hypothetical protein TRVA0_031S01728 [Trichomonascus vanleenenianus]|uniref:Cup2p n=1 Tax=Trichomonascus vanleenenianus TaxID=2268995 RepID=UPI003EC9F37A